jgi:hypothetical protein
MARAAQAPASLRCGRLVNDTTGLLSAAASVRVGA